MAARKIYPVVMCGGAGTRLWPASQHAHPKQFLRLTGAKSMFQQTVLRVEALATGRPVIIGNIQHADAIELQLADIGVGATILLEPCVRDSAPAIAAAVAAIAQEDPDAIAVVVASDHYIPDDSAFRDAVLAAAKAAHDGLIVTLGVKATHPSTAYGYIKPGRSTDAAVVRVEAFIEKPGPAKAADYVQAGYLWNSGNFIFAVDTMLNEFDRHAPQVADAAKRSVRDAERDGRALRLAASFSGAPKISLDYAVMEKTSRAAVLPVDFFWSDLGAWNAVHEASSKDASGNSTSGDCTLVNVERCFVRNETRIPVAAVGVSDIAIIAEPTGLLVCDLSASQAVKSVAEKLSVGGRTVGVQPVADALAEWAARYEHWLATAALPLWWTLGADHHHGGFHEMLDAGGGAVPSPRRARVQARQVFVYASAQAVGWKGPAREAALHGMRWFRGHYLRADGLFRSQVDAEGRETDDTATLYDQSFALLAMASLHGMSGAPAGFGEEAENLLAAINAALRHEAGGFRETDSSAFQSNPHMHLLEAALAWAEAGGGAVWEALADRIVALCLSRFVDPDDGFLREHFNAQWGPALGERGRLVEPGHQFEWAWLLARWARRRNEPAAELAARRLFAAGARGIDPVRGVAVDAMNEDLAIRSSRARLWPQTERLKAALLLHANREDADDSYLAHAQAAAESLWRYLEMPTRGLWRDKLTPTNRFVEEPSPASSFYHIAGAVAALKDFRAAQSPAVPLAAQ
ncbi:MAG TPA: AGE family epimerase/isomerase [Rhizomicrobium sp.]|jgi:mannose-1-phosphate guanylyltransferase/mannose-6-phosphate isomerase|nr:AGE family epimerase/isomerase [Rhizomicrobium sp.]